MGKISTNSYVDIFNVMRKIIIDVDSNDLATGFDGNICGILTSINSQSPDIAIGANESIYGRDFRYLELLKR